MKYLAGLLACISGCGVTGYEKAFVVPEKEVSHILKQNPFPEWTARRQVVKPVPEKSEKLKLTLDDCVSLAFENNRDYLASLENLYRKVIDARVAAHNYWPLAEPLTVTQSISKTEDNTLSTTTSSQSITVASGISQRLPFGGKLSLTPSVTSFDPGSPSTSASVTGTLILNLARGSGFLVELNPLISSARAVTYGKREFENAKQLLAIGIVSKFYSIVQQQKTIGDLEKNLETSKKTLAESETKFKFGKVSKVDVFRAEFQATTSENDYLIAVENLKILKDSLKIDLGLEPAVEMEMQAEDIPFEEQYLDEKFFVAVALDQNLLWKNTRDQFEDAKRSLVVAYDLTRASLDLTTTSTQSLKAEKTFGTEDMLTRTSSIALTLNVPLDRIPINRDFQNAIYQFLQQERRVNLSRDELIRQTREKMIQVRQSALTVKAQQQAVDQAQKSLTLLVSEYQRGIGFITNRDIIEAQNNLVRSQISFQRSRVDYKIRFLELKQFCGMLEIDDEGKWLN